MGMDQSIPRDYVSFGHFVEQLSRMQKSPALAVHIEKSGSDEEVRSEAQLDDGGMCLLSGRQRRRFGGRGEDSDEAVAGGGQVARGLEVQCIIRVGTGVA